MTEYRKALANNKTVQRLGKKAASGKITAAEMTQLAGECGDVAGECMAEQLFEAYPNGHVSEPEVRKIVSPIMREMHRVISEYSAQMINAQYKEAGIGLKAVNPDYDTKSEDDLVKEISRRSFEDE